MRQEVNADAELFELDDGFEHLHIDTGSMQSECCRHAANTAACDQYFHVSPNCNHIIFPESVAVIASAASWSVGRNDFRMSRMETRVA